MKRSLPYIAFGLFVAQIALIVVSWVLSAGVPGWGVRSLLSAEGLRWLLGGYSTMLATPVLVCLLLLSMACGCIADCGILRYCSSECDKSTSIYRKKTALHASLVFALLYLSATSALVLVPDAVMLSVIGGLFPSPFSSAIVPLLSLGAILLAAIYGLLAGTLNTIAAIYNACLSGIRLFAPVFLFYILLFQLYRSILYVVS